MTAAGGWVHDAALHWRGPAGDSAVRETATTRPARHDQK